MADMNSIACPFCAMSIPAGATSCPNCGGFVPATGGSGDDRPSSRPGGMDFTPPPAMPSLGEPPRASSFGIGVNKPSSPGFGSPPSSPGFGSPPSSPGFGAPPPMGTFPRPPAGSQSRTGRNVVIGIVIAVVVLFLVMCGVVMCGGGMAAVWFMRGTGGASDAPSQPIAVNVPVEGDITFSRDAQVYAFTLAQTGMVTITVTGNFDNYLELYRGTESNPFMEDDDSGGSLNAAISTTLTPGSYYARVRAYSSGTTGHFTLIVSAPAELPYQDPSLNPGWGPSQPFPPTVPSVPGFVQPQTFQGIVSSVGGVAPVNAGAQCTVALTGEAGGANLNCRVNVTCGSTVVYGGERGSMRFGYVHCDVSEVAGRQAVVAHDVNPTDTEGDPMIDLDTGAGTIVVSDRVRGSEWNLRIQFTGPQTSI